MMAFHRVDRFKAHLSNRLARAKRPNSLHSRRPGLEILEGRQLLATWSVTNLNNNGVGSLRQAIVDANDRTGADTIDFDVAGTITVGRISLPSITSPVTIDGSTAPTFAGWPVVTVNFHGSKGFNFVKGSDGSTLGSLSLVNASNAGVLLNASRVTVEGNEIGLLADGKTVAGNRGDGVQINASSRGDLIGHANPVTSITYANTAGVSLQPVSAWQGLRAADTPGQFLITGTSGVNGLLYEGPISGVGGTSYAVNVPGATSTSVYGPDVLPSGGVRLVGSYKNGDGTVQGFLFQGSTADLSTSGDYRTIDYPGATYTYVHSTMGDLAVGNADGPEGNAPIGTGHAFLYDVAQSTLLPDIVYPGSTSTTAYGIWSNGGTSYTIAGGSTNLLSSSRTVGSAYLVDYNSATGQFTNWTSFDYPNGVNGQDYETHFEGISSVEKGVYTISADSVQTGSSNPVQGSLVTVRRNTDGSFGAAAWVDLDDPTASGVASANSVSGNEVVGIVAGGSGVASFQATVNTGFQLSNVISGNGGNGIGIYGASDDQVAMNDIGTDATGMLARGNAKNGIFVTKGSTANLIGGQSTGGNDPTASVFDRPPQGNLISGNHADGVLINNGSTGTLLSGNFVGTAASGNSALGNRHDGVAIVNADGNSLIGCTLQQDPFVFYNVLSGNVGNGLRVTNANNTTVQANFMGVGADNDSIVANGGDGLLISGSSKNTQVGGVIPLGNVIAGNNRNGIEVSGKASGFVSFNTFGGVYAFGGAAPNRRDGIFITSIGGNNTVRTSIISGNLGNGIELGGNATGVQITDTAIGTNTSIQSAIPNGGDGILITGNAHDNAIGGFQVSVVPQVTVSSNVGYGIAMNGTAHDNVVYHTNIGTNTNSTLNLGNQLGGIILGPGTLSNTIGGSAAALQDEILDSGGAGLTISSSGHNSVLGDQISDNSGTGLVMSGGQSNQIGSATAGNTISNNGLDGVDITGGVTCGTVQGNQIDYNQGYGLDASGANPGTVVQGNAIESNTQGNVNLTGSSGIKYIPA